MECPAAFVIFKTRYAASCAARALQSSNPMLWVTHLAPEPRDVHWQNLAIPYKQFWLRRTSTFLATAAFLVFFIAPVALVQSLANLAQLQQMFPFLRGLLKKKYMSQLITGYLPSVILVLFFYTVPPLMMLFSTIEGSVSRSERKRGACCKVLSFTIWNVFFVNIASGTVLNKLDVFSEPTSIPLQLASGAVPAAMLNVYITEYDSGGRYWPIVHNSTIFSLVLAQVIVMGLFALKKSTACLGFTVPLTIMTLLYNEYSRRRFQPVFHDIAAEVLIDLDQEDEQSGQMEEIHQQVQSAYCQLDWFTYGSTRIKLPYLSDEDDCWRRYTQELKPGGEFSRELGTSEYSKELRATEHSRAIRVHEPIQVSKKLRPNHNTGVEPKS